MTRLYTGHYERPKTCGCGKKRYASEEWALAAAERQGLIFETSFRAYKCPGTSVWHLATRGFHPRALKSRPRVMAWHLSARGVMSEDGLLAEFGLKEYTDRYTNVGRQILKTLRVFGELGLVRLGDPRRGYITATDLDGLGRVMAVGLQDYAASRGVNLRAPSPALPTAPGDNLGGTSEEESKTP